MHAFPFLTAEWRFDWPSCFNHCHKPLQTRTKWSVCTQSHCLQSVFFNILWFLSEIVLWWKQFTRVYMIPFFVSFLFCFLNLLLILEGWKVCGGKEVRLRFPLPSLPRPPLLLKWWIWEQANERERKRELTGKQIQVILITNLNASASKMGMSEVMCFVCKNKNKTKTFVWKTKCVKNDDCQE